MRPFLLLSLLACTSAEDDTAVDTERPVAPWPAAEEEVLSLSGDITWTVDFDEAAEAAGKTDCSYTRHYEGHEDRSRPWTCRSCAAAFKTEVVMTAGLDDCYPQITQNPMPTTEWIGHSGSTWWRSAYENRFLANAGTARLSGGTLTISQTAETRSYDGQGLRFEVSGTLVTGQTIADPLDGMGPPELSSCGWDRSIREYFDGSTRMAVDRMLPDAFLPDACGEGNRLQQFVGDGYLVVAFVARGNAASEALVGGFAVARDEAAAQDIALDAVVLLATGEEDPWSATSTELLATWADEVGWTGPVLDHRGYGGAVLADGDDVVWPAVAVVAPDLDVIAWQRGGFSGWDSVIAAIEEYERTP